MKIKKIFVALFTIAACVLALLIITGYALFAWGFRPLYAIGKWRVSAESFEGVSMPVKTYKMLGSPEPLFVCVQIPRELMGSPYPRFYDGGNRETTRDIGYLHKIIKAPKRWFVIFTSGDNTPRASLIHPPETLPYLHFNTTRPYDRFGIDINNDWLRETWHLTREKGVVVLSNELFSISVSNKKEIK